MFVYFISVWLEYILISLDMCTYYKTFVKLKILLNICFVAVIGAVHKLRHPFLGLLRPPPPPSVI